MGAKGRPSFGKRQKEQARRDQQKQKEQQRAERRAQRSTDRRDPSGEDPDIAGIVPGPQPRPEDEG